MFGFKYTFLDTCVVSFFQICPNLKTKITVEFYTEQVTVSLGKLQMYKSILVTDSSVFMVHWFLEKYSTTGLLQSRVYPASCPVMERVSCRPHDSKQDEQYKWRIDEHFGQAVFNPLTS